MAHALPPRPKDWRETLKTIWNRTTSKMEIRSYEIEREFGVKIPPLELANMSFEAVISRINIDIPSQRRIPNQASAFSKPGRESTKLSPEDEARARKIFMMLNWD